MRNWIVAVGAVFIWIWGSVPASAVTTPSLVLQPAAGVPGATVSIAGKGLGGFKSAQVNRVTFGGVPALIQRWDADAVEVRVPSKAQTGPVDVFIGKKRMSAGSFTVVYPKILSIAPQEIEPGHSIEILGEHFGVTAGARDPNTMFGVNDVVIGGVVVRPRRWKDDTIEVEIPTNAAPGEVVVRLASSDPLPDGSCCAPVEYLTSNAVPLALVPSVRVDPMRGPVGTKVVLFGQGFGTKGAEDAVVIGNHRTTIAQWKDDVIVVHVPFGAETGPLVLKRQGKERALGTFTVHVPKALTVTPASAPIALEITNDPTFVRKRLTPTTAAAWSRSRTACNARPARERMMLRQSSATMPTNSQVNQKRPWLRPTSSWPWRNGRSAPSKMLSSPPIELKSIPNSLTLIGIDAPALPPLTVSQLLSTYSVRYTIPSVAMLR